MPNYNQPMPAYGIPQNSQNSLMQQPVQPAQMSNQYFNNQPNQMNFSSQPGLSIVSINSDDVVANYPVASGNTVLLMNFNTNRMCFKSTNANGVPMAPRWATFTYDEPAQQQPQNPNQNYNNGVSRQEFEDLKAMLAQALSQRPQDDFQPSKRANYAEESGNRGKYNGKRGVRNDGSAGPATNNG